MLDRSNKTCTTKTLFLSSELKLFHVPPIKTSRISQIWRFHQKGEMSLIFCTALCLEQIPANTLPCVSLSHCSWQIKPVYHSLSHQASPVSWQLAHYSALFEALALIITVFHLKYYQCPIRLLLLCISTAVIPSVCVFHLIVSHQTHFNCSINTKICFCNNLFMYSMGKMYPNQLVPG